MLVPSCTAVALENGAECHEGKIGMVP